MGRNASCAHGERPQGLRIWSRITSRIACAAVSLLQRMSQIKEGGIAVYSAEVERKMQRFFSWLSEKDRRRYAAVEAAKLGHGGIEYIARVLACDPPTMRQGLRDLEEEEDAAAGRIRKKGVDARSTPARSRPWKRISAIYCRSSRPAIPCAQACCGRICRCASCRDGW